VRRFLYLAAVLLVPFAGVAYLLVLGWRWFHREERLSEATMRDILARERLAESVRELDEMPRGKRTVLDGPPPRRNVAYQQARPR